MTKKHRLVIVAAVLALCLAVVGGAIMMLPARGLSKGNFDRVEKGMSRVEVVQILGQLTGQFHPGGWIEVVDWVAADGTRARVGFDNGVVVYMEFHESTETIPDKLRRWTRVVR